MAARAAGGAVRAGALTYAALMKTAGLAILLALAATAAIAHPGSGIVVDRNRNVYFMDTGSGVWKIGADGRLTGHEGPAFHWMAIDDESRFAGANLPSIPSAELRSIGAKPTLIVSSDFPIAVGRDGALYYPELGSDARLRIIRFTAEGARSVHAILPSKADGGKLRWLNGLAAAADGSLFYTENKAVRKIDGRGMVTTLAAQVSVANCTGIPSIERSSEPYLRGLAVTADGTIFVAATGCGAVLKITPAGQITTVLRTTAPWSPTAVAVAEGTLYVLEYVHTAEENRPAWVPRVRTVSPKGTVATIATVTRK
jgi:hypothetical protein